MQVCFLHEPMMLSMALAGSQASSHNHPQGQAFDRVSDGSVRPYRLPPVSTSFSAQHGWRPMAETTIGAISAIP
jgi:hypothetical protein